MRKIKLLFVISICVLICLSCDPEEGYLPAAPENITFLKNPVKIGEELRIEFTWTEPYHGFSDVTVAEDGTIESSLDDPTWEDRVLINLGLEFDESNTYPGQLSEDGNTLFWFPNNHGTNPIPVQKYTDVFFTDEGTCYITFIVPDNAVSGFVQMLSTAAFNGIGKHKLIVQDADGNVIEAQE